MNVLVVTDNRFWREELGSQRRISSLCTHLLNRGHSLHIVFQGFLFPQDRVKLTSVCVPYALDSLGNRNAPSYAKELPPVRRAARTAWKCSKRVAKQILIDSKRWYQRRLSGQDSVRRFWLQVLEPKLADFADPKLLDRFREACRRIKPRVVIIEYVRLAYLLQGARDVLPPDCLTLIDTHDLQHERQSRFHASRERHDIDITPAEEAVALSLADAIIAIQPTDAVKFSKLLPERRVIVAGFPTEIHDHPLREAGARPVRIGFFGSDMLPNCDVARTLICRLFPPLREVQGAGVELHVFGSVCDAFPDFREVPGVTLHGFVDDLDAAYEGLDVIANPVSFGGGLKIKNVEALSHGRPLVTTPIGAEGLERGIDSAFLVAGNETEFAAKLARVVSDENLRLTLAAAAREFAHQNLGEEAVYSELDSVLDQLETQEESPAASGVRTERRARDRREPVANREAAWYVTNPDPRRADLRYRCLYPMLALKHKGWNVRLVDTATDYCDSVVFDGWSLFSTMNDDASADRILEDALRLKDRGARIVLDNSDNQFAGESNPTLKSGCARLRKLATCADSVVACSAYLAEVMQKLCQLDTPPIVIGDPAEDEIHYLGNSAARAQLSIKRKINWLRYLQHRLTIQDEIREGRTPLVWFGQHDDAMSSGGMFSLLAIQEQLESLNQRHPVSLTVISNHRGKFTHKMGHWQLPMHYLDWDRATFLPALRLHMASLIPITIDEYSSAKSSNRVVLSLLHGLNVVCDPIPSYQEFAQAIGFGNWESNIAAYITHPALRTFHVKSGREIIRTRYALPVIAEQWAQVLFPEKMSAWPSPAVRQLHECA